MSNTYRISKEAVKSSNLNASSILCSIPCDRDAELEKVVISSRAGITANNTHYSTLQVKNGSTVLASRAFNSGDLAALTPEPLTVTSGDVSESTGLELRYVHNGNGLALDLDVVLVFRLSRPV